MGEVRVEVSQKRFTEALWQEVWRQPWSMQVRSVLGDALLEAGDLHGELIHVQLALERLPDDDDESEAGDLREVRAALMAREQQLLKCLRPLLLARNRRPRSRVQAVSHIESSGTA